jgi:hypothetical protein
MRFNFYNAIKALFTQIVYSKITALALLIFLAGNVSASVSGYGDGEVSVSVDYSTGYLNVNWRDYRTNSSCDDYMHTARVYYRIGQSGSWIQIYDQNSYISAVAHSSSAANERRTTIFRTMPANFFEQTVQVRFTGSWKEEDGFFCDGNTNGKDFTYTLNNTINGPRNVTASSSSYCDKVRLTWDDGTNVDGLGATRVRIIRNGVAASNYLNTSTNLADYTEGPTAVDLNLSVQTYLEWTNDGQTRQAYGGTVNITGKKYGPPGKAEGLYLEQANCNGQIQVSWNWSSANNPSNFLIERAADSNFTSITTLTVSGSDRSVRDANTLIGQKYYYRVYAQDNCPNSTTLKAKSEVSTKETEVGLGIPPTTTVKNISVNSVNKSVTLTWRDNTNLEDGFKVVRQSGSGQVEFDVAPNDTSFTDNTADNCTNYTYLVKTYNSCKTTGVISSNSLSAYIPSDISQTFSNNGKLEATDGEFGERIDIKWSTPNKQNDDWSILRINPITNDTVPIANLDGRVKSFTDNTADANTLYKYLISGESNCAGNVVFSDTTSDFGFRLAFGTINGQITYSGGSAVKGVKVTALAASGASGKSGGFNGSSSYATIPNSDKLSDSLLSVLAYIRPNTTSGIQTVISKVDSTKGYQLYIESNQLKIKLGTTTKQVAIPNFSAGNWISVGAIVSSDSVKLLYNGKILGVYPHTEKANIKNSSSIEIGRKGTTNYFNGEIDEVRLYNRALTNVDYERSYDVYINPSMNGLMGYWRFDEGFGTIAYDYSKTLLTTNKNHATLTNVAWSNSKPTTSQLTAGAYTDSLGSYFIPFVPYLGTGDNYTIRPEFGTHTFTPATTTLLIGSGSANYTGQNFTDKSSFTVSGSVKFKNTSCYVEGARIKIDGEVVIRNGEVAMTNDTGKFTIQVPIGPHVITVEQTSHVYSDGRYPATGTRNFQQNVTNIEFIDSTLVKVVGRVAGGSIQKALPPNLGKGKNNIGVATIPFKSQQGNGCLTTQAITNNTTGEYSINLPPMRYEIPNFSVTSNASIQFNDNTLLDITNVPPVVYSTDSVFRDSLGIRQVVRIDSANYQRQRDFLQTVSPSVDVRSADRPVNKFGSDTITYSNAGVKILIPADSLGLNYPIFEENKEYTWNISAFQVYTNKDNGMTVLDSVPMSEGNIIIVNNLASEPRQEFRFRITDTTKFTGIQAYTFTGGQSNTAADQANPQYSFSKVCEITLAPQNGNAVSWKPNTTDPNSQFFRGIVFGGKALGNSFATAGPQVVTMVLRDPPGTGSSASWERATTVTNSYSFGIEAGIASNLSSEIKLGTAFDVGLGYTTPTKIEASAKNNISVEASIGANGELVESSTNSLGISTGTTDEFVGRNADLFFGRSMNMDFGLSQVLSLINVNHCNGNCASTVYRFNGVDYKIGTYVSMYAIPKGYQTEFVFTQYGIENSVIPKLEALRDQLLKNPSKYQSVAATHPNFGKSNDDITLPNPTPDPDANSLDDSTGASYTFKGYVRIDTPYVSPFTGISRNITMYEGVDSVWWYNKQIKLWQNALAENERAKVTANQSNLDRNVSYQGGSSITYSNTTTKSLGGSISLGFNLSKEMTLAVGAEIGGTGAKVEQSTSLSMNTNATIGTKEETSTTFSYTFDDPDPLDEFSVDIFKARDGYGPIFKTRGGQTSCPYQGEVKTKYYQPGTILDQATIQFENPGISASPSILYNIPANGQGNINLSLINNGLENVIYSLSVLENTNPNGAILKIDGIDPNRDFSVPASTSISKTLVVEKGPNHIAYDSIGLVFHSRCQYSFGTAAYDDIADTVYFSVNFLSSCTELNVQSPQNQFVANNSYTNVLPVIISGYDINYGGLEKIQLHYKASNQASWVPLGREWFKDTNDIDTRYPNHVDPQLIPRSQSYIDYSFEMDQLIDRNYDLRAISTCKIPQNPDFDQRSSVISGVFDRVNPHPFGSPSPADGVLDPNDDITIRFNEVIEAGSLSPDNFQITGVLNGQELDHSKAVAFDGATGFMQIANGFDFASGSFTIEFWAKRDVVGTDQTIISQGASSSNVLSIGFNVANQIEVKLGSQSSTSSFAISDTAYWHHYTVTYDKNNLALEITERDAQTSQLSTDNNFFANYTSGGKTFIGKSSSTNANFYNGSIHQMRIWNKALTSGEVGSRISQNLHGREAGLIGYWPMDEGKGLLAEDKARFRHAEMKANWEINPKGTSAQFDGISKYVVVDSASTLAITQEMDLSIEFWFKTSGGRMQTFLSNGSGRFISTDVNRNGWNIEMNAQNEIWVKNDSFAFKAVQTNFADNKWHHFALVVNRLANTTSYIDGAQQKTISSADFWGFGATKLALGARYSIYGNQETFDQHFSGHMDEVRIWNTALLRDNIELNRYNRLKGDEFGLLAYYPFESYRLELGDPVLDTSMANQSSVLSKPSRINSRAVNGSVYSIETPAVAIQRPVQKILNTWSVNGDQIVITPNVEAADVENVTLNVSVKDIIDLHGNVMQSPKTWIAFVNKNQVLWQDAEKNLSKELNDTLTFTTKVVNSGGEVKNFTISNIPAWLTATPSSGTINPLSTKTIKFTVNQSVNIGDYTEDVLLTTDFGFNEKLLLKLKVSKTAPNFTVDPTLYQQSMSVIGQIRINGQVSTNPDDKLVAFINGEVRGVANLQYVPTYDKYVVFLDVYSNVSDSIYFQVWNASQGQIHTDINPVLYFSNNDLVGSPASPQYFDAINNISKPIILKSGWNWVSFPLTDQKMKSFHNFFEELNLQNGDMVKTIGNNANAQYGGPSIGWSGNLVNQGIKNDVSYLIKMSVRDTLNYRGLAIDPDTVQINVVTGWNRIGFISLRNMQISTALANYNAQDGDIIKSQERFSYFDSNLGWIGSLQTLEPTKGYLLKSTANSNFVYPRQGLLRLKDELPAQMELAAMLTDGFELNPHSYEAGVSAIVKVEICEEVIENKNIVLAAFNGDELRGWSESATMINEELGYQYFLTAYGEGNDQFEYALIDTITNEKIALSGSLVFEKNGLKGTPNKPLVVNPIDKVDCDDFKVEANSIDAMTMVYPNPFRNSLNVTVPTDLGEAIEVSLIDSYGRVLHQEIAAQGRLLNWSRIAGSKEVAQGVYYIRFSSDEGQKVEKVVKY